MKTGSVVMNDSVQQFKRIMYILEYFYIFMKPFDRNLHKNNFSHVL